MFRAKRLTFEHEESEHLFVKLIAESKGIERLRTVRSEFAAKIRREYEHRATPCSACKSPGICCRDEHFVNVRITRLEAAAIAERLGRLEDDKSAKVYERVLEAIEKFGLNSPDDNSNKAYACPLFEQGVGCLVHDSAKPLPCIAHACYENAADLPPATMLEDREVTVAALNRRVYGTASVLSPIPVAIAGFRRSNAGPQPAADHRDRNE